MNQFIQFEWEIYTFLQWIWKSSASLAPLLLGEESTGNTVCAMLVTRLVEGKNWINKVLKNIGEEVA